MAPGGSIGVYSVAGRGVTVTLSIKSPVGAFVLPVLYVTKPSVVVPAGTVINTVLYGSPSDMRKPDRFRYALLRRIRVGQQVKDAIEHVARLVEPVLVRLARRVL